MCVRPETLIGECVLFLAVPPLRLTPPPPGPAIGQYGRSGTGSARGRTVDSHVRFVIPEQ